MIIVSDFKTLSKNQMNKMSENEQKLYTPDHFISVKEAREVASGKFYIFDKEYGYIKEITPDGYYTTNTKNPKEAKPFYIDPLFNKNGYRRINQIGLSKVPPTRQLTENDLVQSTGIVKYATI